MRLSSDEVDAIAAYLQMPLDEFIAGHTRLTADRSGLSLLENADGSCPFLVNTSEGPGCSIQAVKPRQCRDFPLKWNFPNWEDECAGGRAMRNRDSSNRNE